MSRSTRFLSLFVLAAVSAALVLQRDDIPIPPADLLTAGASIAASNGVPIDLATANPTDGDTIATTVQQVNQKTGPTDNAPPSDSVPPTVVTAVDGDVTKAGQSGSSLLNVLHDPDSHPDLDTGSTVSRRALPLERRGDYERVFDGTGTEPNDRDASIAGTAYLTYARLDTWDIDACQAFCDGIQSCVFVNMFYHFNSDPVYNPQIKCAAYGDVHTAEEKTNFGGQQLLPLPAGATYIQESVGYAATSVLGPATPDGYDLEFGPSGGATSAPGYMGFALLDKYDVQACANLCNTRGIDANGGACQFFNIWRALVDGTPTTYTCTMYYLPTDVSTATNTGQGDLVVTESRGYRRISYVPDGGFESFTCPPPLTFCEGVSSPNWVASSSSGGVQDASLYLNPPYARTGSVSVLFGSASGADALPGTITAAYPLDTVPGQDYLVTFFSNSSYAGVYYERDAFVEVHWNGVSVYRVNTGYEGWTYYQAQVTAAGNDVLAFVGGAAPSWGWLDDVYVFLA